MAKDPATYDLMLLLDSTVPDDARERLLADVETMIQDAGEIVSAHDWGRRTLAYEVAKKPDAELHLIQFHATSRELLERLDRVLRITDGVVRFRIIKLRAGTPAPPDLRAPAATAAAEGGEAAP